MTANDGGRPRRENLERRLEQSRRGKKPDKIAEFEAELAMPAFPKEVAYLWTIYHRLRRRISAGFAGPNPVGWQDIDAFVRQTGFPLVPWEVEIIEALDDAFLNPVLRTPAASPGQQVTNTIDASDTRGVAALLRSMGRRRKGG